MRFAKFYRAIAWEPHISMSAKATLSALAQYADKAGKCWPSRPTLMKDLGCSSRTLSLALNELKLWGIINWIPGNSLGVANIYTITAEKAAANIERGAVPIVSAPPVPIVSANENHSKGVDESPRAKEA